MHIKAEYKKMNVIMSSEFNVSCVFVYHCVSMWGVERIQQGKGKRRSRKERKRKDRGSGKEKTTLHRCECV